MTRAVLDTNIFISALISPNAPPAAIVAAAIAGQFEILIHQRLLDEIREATRYPKVAQRLSRPQAGHLVNALSAAATLITKLPEVRRSPDERDDFLLALSEAGQADYLVTGDKADLLVLKTHRRTRIITARLFHKTLRL